MAKEFRLEILKGNDAGSQFRISGARVLFGRSSDCDVIITDPSASRNHAELIKVEGGFILKDLRSSNGVFVNGKKIIEHFLVSGDVFTIGNHAYRYMEIEMEAVSYKVQQGMDGTIPGISASSSADIVVPGASQAGSAKKKRLILYGGVGGVFFLMIMFLMLAGGGEDTTTPQAKKADGGISEMETGEPEEPVYSARIPDDMREFFNKANEYYFEGKRELRMKNFSRALDAFRKAVTFYPNHAKANYYIKIINDKIKFESETQMRIGKQMLTQRRYDDAIRSFTEVMNLNARDLNSTIFKEAEKLKGVAEKRKGMVIDE